MEHKHIRGQSFPLGAKFLKNGVNFSVFSKHAEQIDLLLFDKADDSKPSQTIKLDINTNRTHNYWHAFVSDIKPGQIYAYRVYGPFEPKMGMCFDSTKVLIDPYGFSVAIPANFLQGKTAKSLSPINTSKKSVVFDPDEYNWEGDQQLRRPSSKMVIYEMHVRGFTNNPNSGVAPNKRGTFAGITQKIPYLQDLGITAVELLPVFQFDPHDASLGQTNYWGYAPISFFAPHLGYSVSKDPISAINEFRDMVKALHRAGIEVILDVVYNHTAEGNHKGQTFCFRGFDNSIYYILNKDRSSYANYSGTGNTINANNAVVRRLILDSLRYWVSKMHVDGFRFDLASILSRDESGNLLPEPPVLWDIDSDPALAGTKLIAEAWDAAGLYQVGSFIGDAWKEWNGHFRDDVRAFFRGEPNSTGRFATRLLGSTDLYAKANREAEKSVNFVTCHDGFTLNDLVTYNDKHNEANLENNCDGRDDNRSWNCGIEGETDNVMVEEIRRRQIKNFFMTTLLSIGLPMIMMGDEVRRSQKGNNNAYCQDNETSWFDWDLLSKNQDIYRFVKLIIRYRTERVIKTQRKYRGLNNILNMSKFEWHGTELGKPDFSEDSHCIALTTSSELFQGVFHMIFNAYPTPLEFELPRPPKGCSYWRLLVDTALPSPSDITDPGKVVQINARKYCVAAHSAVLLSAKEASLAEVKK